jgi:hypothetical protein
MRFSDKGFLTVSWNKDAEIDHEEGKPLFELQIQAIEDIRISDIIELNSLITTSEAYSLEGEILEIELGQRNETVLFEKTELFQNNPNPWIDETVITFSLPKAMNAQIIVYDLAGQLIIDHKADYEAGIQELKLDKTTFNTAGIYYYELITEDDHLSKKMVLMR